MSATASLPPDVIIPGLPPPPGVTPNFTNPEGSINIVTIYAIGWICLALVTITTVIRLYTKVFLIKSHGWEDYTMLVVSLAFVAYFGVNYAAHLPGVGVHQWNVPIQKVAIFAKWAYIIECFYHPLIAVTKLSICLNFLKIFVTNRDRKWLLVQIFIWVNTVYYTICLFLTIFQCSPRARAWNPLIQGSCVNYNAYIVVTGTFNSLSDLLMLAFPMYCIWHLQMTTRKKLGVSALFLIGILAFVASLLRLAYSVKNLHSHDMTYTLTQVALGTFGEVTAGIIVGNLVMFPRFITTITPKVSQFLSSLSISLSLRTGSRSRSRSRITGIGNAKDGEESQSLPPLPYQRANSESSNPQSVRTLREGRQMVQVSREDKGHGMGMGMGSREFEELELPMTEYHVPVHQV